MNLLLNQLAQLQRQVRKLQRRVLYLENRHEKFKKTMERKGN